MLSIHSWAPLQRKKHLKFEKNETVIVSKYLYIFGKQFLILQSYASGANGKWFLF